MDPQDLPRLEELPSTPDNAALTAGAADGSAFTMVEAVDQNPDSVWTGDSDWRHFDGMTMAGSFYFADCDEGIDGFKAKMSAAGKPHTLVARPKPDGGKGFDEVGHMAFATFDWIVSAGQHRIAVDAQGVPVIKLVTAGVTHGWGKYFSADDLRAAADGKIYTGIHVHDWSKVYGLGAEGAGDAQEPQEYWRRAYAVLRADAQR